MLYHGNLVPLYKLWLQLNKVTVKEQRTAIIFGQLNFLDSVSQKIWLNLDHFRNCREFNSVWRISLAFANRPILHYGNGLRNIGGEAPPAQIKVPSAFGKYAPFSIKAPPAR